MTGKADCQANWRSLNHRAQFSQRNIMGTRLEFTKATKLQAWRRAGGRCEICGQLFGERRPDYDHRKPCELGGDNSLENCTVTCPKCHRAKTLQDDMPLIWKSNHVREKRAGLRRSRYRWPKRSFRQGIQR
jgi:5-methylcytosine-specific restriction endonuclease McrA